MRVSRIILSEGVHDIFLVDEGREDKNPLKAGHHLPTSETQLKWRIAGVPMTAQHSMLTC